VSAIRILLCEDQTLVRDGLRTILNLQPGLTVVGEATDGEEAVQCALVHDQATFLGMGR
jgi:DNA-binding NarL/FixJ family response regulator